MKDILDNLEPGQLEELQEQARNLRRESEKLRLSYGEVETLNQTIYLQHGENGHFTTHVEDLIYDALEKSGIKISWSEMDKFIQENGLEVGSITSWAPSNIVC